ncbi:transglutaminase [Microvirga sp. KLBC 81]|uniref:transglutaminase-like cysteine peptidase n=1 Tax=Microvirga sp. KLBC 81 TaxID=1862707 RepID=UPI000D50F443|nr:transglutaminase-like cysteine peptidase [Microvirga sp. KLBC 81]PVE23428.1 transglutaminase [Microvirga sp. KLBC 81]
MARSESCGLAIAALLLATLEHSCSAQAMAKSEKVSRSSHVVLTAQRLAVLRQVNQHVNSTITEVSDLEQYGREDVWTLPASGKGDCEDFALLKRKLLAESGWPTSTLLVTAVQTAAGEPHAVLIARTDKGDYALDNKTSAIRPLAATGYVILSQQSQKSPGKWISAGTGEKTDGPVADFPVR